VKAVYSKRLKKRGIYYEHTKRVSNFKRRSKMKLNIELECENEF